jgi:CRISPR-associated protein Cas2
MSDRHWYLVSYDIRNQKRWRRACRQLLGRGERIQYSLFRCWLNRTEVEALRWELETLLEEEDDLMFIHLCQSCAGRIQERGEAKEWGARANRFEVL